MVVPITPADSGNGLAMRAGMLLDALAPVADLHVVIVPVSGPANGCAWAEARACSVSVVDEAMIARAAALVAHRYSPAVVAPLVQSAVLGRAVLGASDRPGPGRSAAA